MGGGTGGGDVGGGTRGGLGDGHGGGGEHSSSMKRAGPANRKLRPVVQHAPMA